MRTLLSLLLAALLTLLPTHAAEAATSSARLSPGQSPNLSASFALAIEDANFANGSVLDPGFMQKLRGCPICRRTGLPNCPPNPPC
jgi:hypothetical protein